MKNESLKNFIERASLNFSRISYFDVVKSSYIFYFIFGFAITWVSGVSLILAKPKGATFIIIFVIGLVLIIFLWRKLFFHYQNRSSFCRKVYQYRFSKALSEVTKGLSFQVIKSNPRLIEVNACQNKKEKELKFSYCYNYGVNIKGIIVGTPLARSASKELDPRTWAFVIEGKTDQFKDDQLEFEFTYSKKTKDLFADKKIKVFDYKKAEIIKSLEGDKSNFLKKLKGALSGSALSGTVEFERGKFVITIFDNIRTINRYKRPIVDHKNNFLYDLLKEKNIQIESVAFFGVEKILNIFFQTVDH